MSLTQTERKILERNGFQVHKYADAYVELIKGKMIISYDSLEQTAYDGLKEFDSNKFSKVLEELKNGKSRNSATKNLKENCRTR